MYKRLSKFGLIGFLHFAKSLLNSFEADFGPFESQIDSRSRDVKEEIRLASVKAVYQDQQLQIIERKEQSKLRKVLGLFSQKIDMAAEESRNWRLQRDERESSKLFVKIVIKGI